jgi:hypothetical protein
MCNIGRRLKKWRNAKNGRQKNIGSVLMTRMYHIAKTHAHVDVRVHISLLCSIIEVVDSTFCAGDVGVSRTDCNHVLLRASSFLLATASIDTETQLLGKRQEQRYHTILVWYHHHTIIKHVPYGSLDCPQALLEKESTVCRTVAPCCHE